MSRKPALQKPSRAVWPVYLGFAFLSFSGFLRMIDSITNWYWLNFSGVQPGPWYLAASGGLWGLAGLAALAWLLFSLPWRRQVAAGAALLYGATYWVDRLFVAQPDGILPNGGITAVVMLLGLGYVFLVLQPWLKIDTE